MRVARRFQLARGDRELVETLELEVTDWRARRGDRCHRGAPLADVVGAVRVPGTPSVPMCWGANAFGIPSMMGRSTGGDALNPWRPTRQTVRVRMQSSKSFRRTFLRPGRGPRRLLGTLSTLGYPYARPVRPFGTLGQASRRPRETLPRPTRGSKPFRRSIWRPARGFRTFRETLGTLVQGFKKVLRPCSTLAQAPRTFCPMTSRPTRGFKSFRRSICRPARGFEAFVASIPRPA